MSLIVKVKDNTFTYDNKENIVSITYTKPYNYYELSNGNFVPYEDSLFNPISSNATNIVNLFTVTTSQGTISCDQTMWIKNGDNIIQTKSITVLEGTYQILTLGTSLNISSNSYNIRVRSFK